MTAARWSMSARRVAVLVAVGVAARLVLAGVLGLGTDESYEVVLARVPSLGYFDHPPLSFWIPALVARLTGSEHRVVLRLPFVLLFAITTVLLYRLTARLYGGRAGFLAALLLNITPVFSLSTGGWILPDGPLACAILATALCLTHVLLERSARPWQWWIGAGAATGMALLSKYHGVFLPAGTLLFLVSGRESRSWLRRPEPYLAIAIALVISTPVLVWNAQHGFASVRFQAGRATTHGLHVGALVQSVGGQLGYLLPWIGVPLLWQLVRGLLTGPRDGPRWLLCCLAVGPIALFTLISLGGNPGLPHWPAPGYLLLFPLLGDGVARYESRGPRERRTTARAITAASVVFVLLVVVAASDVATGWAVRVAPRLFERGDPSLEAVDWRDVRPELMRRGLLDGHGELVVATHWIEAAKIGYALGPSIPVLCLSDDPRGFQYAYSPHDFVGRDAVMFVRVGRGSRPVDVVRTYGRYFAAIVPVDTIGVRRAGRVEIELAVFRAHELLRP
jgi:Dolichyl-phosphate-mannose-protein mannosyltransferase